MTDLLQWPALVLSIIGAWLVGGSRANQRFAGFLLFLASNVLWAAWGLGIGAWGVAITQAFFTWTSLRGIRTNYFNRN
jgi:hypothetical protein